MSGLVLVLLVTFTFTCFFAVLFKLADLGQWLTKKYDFYGLLMATFIILFFGIGAIYLISLT